MRESSESKTPWMYLVMSFAFLAMAFVFLPACDNNGNDADSCGSGDDLCVEVFELEDEVFVPVCAMVGPVGPDNCAEDHYHGSYFGFFGRPGDYFFETSIFDPDEVGCGWGTADEVEDTQTTIDISQANLNAYQASREACWVRDDPE